MSYPSQKSCVKIWFGLVEIGGMGVLHVTCDTHLRTWPIYFTQKSCVKIWFGLVEPFKSYRVHKQTYKHPKFSGGQKPPIRGVTCDLRCPFSNLDELFRLKVMCENLVWIGWNRKYVNFQGGQKPLVRGGYTWPAVPIFELGRAISLKSHVWKFGSDWLSFSRVIVSTNEHTNIKKKMFRKTAQYFLDTTYQRSRYNSIMVRDIEK